MNICGKCGTPTPDSAKFCTVCGTPTIPTHPAPSVPYFQQQPQAQQYWQQQPLPANNPHHLAARGFAQTFGLHPASALLTVVVNTMVFTSGLVTGGVGWLLSIPIGLVLGLIIFLAQKKWYGDDNEEAFIKALIVAFLTAIPTSLPGYLTIPSGIIGFFRRKD